MTGTRAGTNVAQLRMGTPIRMGVIAITLKIQIALTDCTIK